MPVSPARAPALPPVPPTVITQAPPPTRVPSLSATTPSAGAGRELDALVRALARVEQHGDVDVDASAREAVTRHVRALLALRLAHLAALLPALHGPSGLWAAMDALMLAEPTSQVRSLGRAGAITQRARCANRCQLTPRR